jgi:signal transduction histidine kinase
MAGIERRVREALQEMRIAIDALQPQTGELGTMLGSLRYRLDDTIRASGVGLVWDVRDLPESVELSPSTVFALQRVLLGAITNVLNHANASTLKVTAKATNEGNMEITVEDNGVGFDVGDTAASPGLVSMRTRAEQLGGSLKIDSRPGVGTRVHLQIAIDAMSSAVVGFANPGGARLLSAGAGAATA